MARVEAYLNGLTTLRARFLQIAQNGAAAEGTAWISRPAGCASNTTRRSRCCWWPMPGSSSCMTGNCARRRTLLISQTPLGILLREQVRLSGDVTVTGIERSGGFLRVTMYRTREPERRPADPGVQPDPMELRQWAVVDAQGRETRVSLFRVETRAALPGEPVPVQRPALLRAGRHGRARKGGGG